jgi:hypothetical protein
MQGWVKREASYLKGILPETYILAKAENIVS